MPFGHRALSLNFERNLTNFFLTNQIVTALEAVFVSNLFEISPFEHVQLNMGACAAQNELKGTKYKSGVCVWAGGGSRKYERDTEIANGAGGWVKLVFFLNQKCLK